MRITDFLILNDIKNEYTQLRQSGLSRALSIEALQQDCKEELSAGANDDGLLFWIGLADAQYALRELTCEVAAQALSALEAIEKTDYQIIPSDIARRREHYAKAPMPERGNIGARKKYRCNWSFGDTFAYRLSGQKAETMGVAGKYILLRKVDEIESWDGRLLPIVTLSFWHNPILPANTNEFRQVPLLRLASERLGLPVGQYEYRVEVLFKRKKQLNDLQYLGNFSDVMVPADEVIVPVPDYMLMIQPERFSDKCCAFLKMHNYYSNNI